MIGFSLPLADNVSAELNPLDGIIYLTFGHQPAALSMWLDPGNAAELRACLEDAIRDADRLTEEQSQASEADPATTTDPNLQRETRR